MLLISNPEAIGWKYGDGKGASTSDAVGGGSVGLEWNCGGGIAC